MMNHVRTRSTLRQRKARLMVLKAVSVLSIMARPNSAAG